MKKLLLIVMCMLSLNVFACGKKGANQKVDENLPTTARFSNQFSVFWHDFVYEVNNSKKGLKKFTPSSEMVEHYALAKDGKTYYFCGYLLTTGKDFDVEAVRAMGVQLNELITDTYSFRCPLNKLPEFVKVAGVKTFEGGKKLNPLH